MRRSAHGGTVSHVQGERTVSSYFGAFGPAPPWDELVSWPPDVFALANLILDHTESYRFVIAPRAGCRWPPLPDWNAQVRAAAQAWREAVSEPDAELPELVRRSWDTLTRCRETPLPLLRSGEAPELVEALLTLHATADEACANIVGSSRATDRSFEDLAWRRLQEYGSLSRLAPARVRIVPKTHLCPFGITISSLSRYLALSYESVDIRWRRIEPEPSVSRGDYTIVLVPWPLSVRACDFRPVSPVSLENMDTDLFGFFEFAPEQPLDFGLLGALLQDALDQAGRVDAVVFPEGAVSPQETAGLEQTLEDYGASFLIAGVRQPNAASFGRNYLHFGVRTPTGWDRYEQDKHHRWCVDGRQIRQYHLTRSLDPEKLWWEAIELHERRLHVVDVGRGVTTAPLVCEDLARLDEVADVVRRIGPSLVVAVLLDGPQLSSRWPSRYASILADEPGSTVLTLTSYGMAARSRPPGTRRSRVIAHWTNRRDGLHEIELAPRAAAVLLTASVDSRTLWTADGRSHSDVPGLALAGVRQLQARTGAVSTRRGYARRRRAVTV